jgi:hypothetical protein
LIASSHRLAVVPTSPVQGQPQADEPEALPQALRADELGLSDAARAAHADLAAMPAGEETAISDRGQAQMKKLVEVARRAVGGKRPGGYCYRAVHLYLMRAGYGHLRSDSIPWLHTRYARHFGGFLNQDDHAARLGLRKLPIDNPYDAPPGSVVVVRSGTPGTRHPTAGDIAVAAGNGKFYNDGNMSYGGPENFPPGNRHVVRIYARL